MGIGPAIFESAGKRSEHYVPGAFSRSNTVSSGSGGVSAGNGVILGRSTGGKPQQLMVFSSVAEAKDALVEGELLDGIAHAFNPGNDYIPQRVFGMRVNPGTQAARTLKNGIADILTIKTWDYGVYTNQLKMKLLAGTKSNTLKFIMNYRGNEIVSDNIGRDSFSVQYTGSGTSPVLEITNNQLVITVEGEPDSITIPFDESVLVEEIVTKLNDTGVYAAVLLDNSTGAKSSNLDDVSGKTIATSTVIRSNLSALISALLLNDFVGSVETAASAQNLVPDLDTDFVYFSGGIAGVYDVSEWNKALLKLEAEDIQIVSTPSIDTAVHTLIANHCLSMSSVINRKERTFLLGGAIGESVEEAVATAGILGTKYGSYCFPSIVASNPLTGETEKLPASYFACKLLGMEASVAVNEPLTWKSVKVLEFGKNLRTTEMEALIKGGVLCGGTTDDNRLAVIRAMTTHQGNELQDVERSMVREDLYMNRDLRLRYSRGVGKPGISVSGSEEESTFKMAAAEWRALGLISPTESGENYWGLSIRVVGDKRYITFSRYLTAPQNFFFITANNFVYGESTTMTT